MKYESNCYPLGPGIAWIQKRPQAGWARGLLTSCYGTLHVTELPGGGEERTFVAGGLSSAGPEVTHSVPPLPARNLAWPLLTLNPGLAGEVPAVRLEVQDYFGAGSDS